MFSLVEDTQEAPAERMEVISSFSEIRPPVMTGTWLMLQMRVRILGISAGSTSITSGFTFWICFSRLEKARESITKNRSTVNIESFLAYFTNAGFVEMIPSASVRSLIKSTAISFEASPVIRSIWTTASFPAAFIFATISEILQIFPKRMKIMRPLQDKDFSRLSKLLTAAMTGDS